VGGDGLVIISRSDPLQLLESRRNHYGREVLSRNRRNAPQCLRSALINRKDSILFHDNARPHVAQSMLQKLNDLGYETLLHPPYSPDFSPTDYHFFKHLDHFLQEKVFNNYSGVENAF